MLVMILVITGGIYTGLMTPTEAAAVSCLVAAVIAIIYRKFSFVLIREASLSALRTSCMILLILVGARILGNGMSLLGIPLAVTNWAAGLEVSRVVVWSIVIVLYLILGCFMDGVSLLLLTLPVSFPLLTSLSFGGLWFGVLVTILIECALITPPVGMNLYVIHGISGGKRIEDAILGIVPFFLVMLVAIALFTYFPWLVTWFTRYHV